MNEAHRIPGQYINPTLVEQAMALILPARRIALIAHENPDGDCIGSALGLAHILHEVGKTCVPACADAAPRMLAFLPGIEMLRDTLDDEDFDLVIALDAGELARFGSLYERHRAFLDSATILNIDHHISSSGCGRVNIIDPIAAATAELLVLFQQQAGMLRDIEGVQIAAFFKSYDEPAITRLSLRCAAPYSAAAICQRFGGGGHERAAGATLHMPIEEAPSVVVAALEQELQNTTNL